MAKAEIEETVIKQLDTLKSTVINTCEEYETKKAPLNLIDKSIKLAQVDLKKVKGRKFTKFFREYNATLNLMNKMCIENAGAMNVEHVPLSVFEMFIDEIKKGFTNGLSKHQENGSFTVRR